MKRLKFVVVPLTVLALLALTVGVVSANGQVFRELHHESQGEGDPSWTQCMPEAAWNGHDDHRGDWQGEVCDPGDDDDDDEFCEEFPNDPECQPPPPPCTPNTAAAPTNCPPPPRTPPPPDDRVIVCLPNQERGQSVPRSAAAQNDWPNAVFDGQDWVCYRPACDAQGNLVFVHVTEQWPPVGGTQAQEGGVCTPPRTPPEEAPPTGEFGLLGWLWSLILSLFS